MSTPTPHGLIIHGDAAISIAEHVAPGTAQLAYLDPPYNTGRTFTQYQDRMQAADWTGMMRAVLTAVHTALADTGSVWVHLDDNEHHTARSLLEEIFGADQFVANIVWERKKKPSYLHGHVAAVVDHILVYAKDRNQLPKFTMPGSATVSRVPLAQGKNPVRTLTFPAGSVQLPGIDRTIPAGDQSTPSVRIHLNDDITVRAGVNVTEFSLTGELRWTQETLSRHLADGVQLRAPKLPVRVNAYIPTDGKAWSNLWTRATGMATNEDAREHQRALFGHDGFDTPKPEELLARIIETTTTPGDLVIDPFGGSGTTAAAAHKLRRNWVTVESNADTIRDYIVPRMNQVVDGTDRGGISTHPTDTTTKLPPAFTPRDARLAAQWVRDLAGSGAFDTDASNVIDVLARAARASKRTDTWEGGGDFQTHTRK